LGAPTRWVMVVYLLLSFGITWFLVAPIAASHQGWVDWEVAPTWHWVGALGPLVGALIANRLGRRQLGSLLRKLAAWRVSPWFYLAALSPILLLIPAAVVTRVVDGASPEIGALSESARLTDGAWLLTLAVPALAYGLGEEMGWRGVAVPYFQSRMRPLRASLVVGLIWVAWHVPFYFYRQGMVGASTGEWVAQSAVIIIGGFFLAWLYNSTGGSILLCTIWHTSHSVVHITVPEISMTWEESSGFLGTLFAIAVIIIWREHLSTTGRAQTWHDSDVSGTAWGRGPARAFEPD